MQNIVNSILYKQFRQPKVSFEHDPKSSCTAYTDGTETHINTANGVIQYYTKRSIYYMVGHPNRNDWSVLSELMINLNQNT